MGGDHHNKNGPLILTIVIAVLSLYIFAFLRLICHEFAHAIVGDLRGVWVERITLGGKRFNIDTRSVAFSFGFHPFEGHVRFADLNYQSDMTRLLVIGAGPLMDVFYCAFTLLVSYAFLPTAIFYGILGVAIYVVCSTIESAFHRGQDMNYVLRLTFPKLFA